MSASRRSPPTTCGIGDDLKIRWDIAFFQMMLETGNLTFKGDVSAKQNNFAGMGATGNHVPGESFPDVATGVKAHLQHLLLYAGVHLDNPVAERTRKVQEWGVLHRMAEIALRTDQLRGTRQAVGADVAPLCPRHFGNRRSLLRQPLQKPRSEPRAAGARQARLGPGEVEAGGPESGYGRRYGG